MFLMNLYLASHWLETAIKKWLLRFIWKNSLKCVTGSRNKNCCQEGLDFRRLSLKFIFNLLGGSSIEIILEIDMIYKINKTKTMMMMMGMRMLKKRCKMGVLVESHMQEITSQKTT